MRTHGLSSSYNHGCRCTPCRQANNLRIAKFREAHYGQPPKVHNISTYANWGCRCEICYDANSKYQRSYQERVRANA